MSWEITRKETGSNIAALEAGSYTGICIGLVDVGTQYNEKFATYSHQIVITWEIVGETVSVKQEDGTEKDMPRWVSETYTLSLDPKSKLCKTIAAWGNISVESLKSFDLMRLIGKGCQMQISTTAGKQDPSKTYNHVAAVIGLPKGMKVEKPASEPFTYRIEEYEGGCFETLPKWYQQKIMASKEWEEVKSAAEVLDIPEEVMTIGDEDLPF